MPNATVIVLAIVLGGLFALIGYGARGYHPMISFVLRGCLETLTA